VTFGLPLSTFRSALSSFPSSPPRFRNETLVSPFSFWSARRFLFSFTSGPRGPLPTWHFPDRVMACPFPIPTCPFFFFSPRCPSESPLRALFFFFFWFFSGDNYIIPGSALLKRSALRSLRSASFFSPRRTLYPDSFGRWRFRHGLLLRL